MASAYEHIERASFYLKEAEQTLNFTYPLLKENKILLVAANNLFLATSNAMTAIIMGCENGIECQNDDFETKTKKLRRIVSINNCLDCSAIESAIMLKEICSRHLESPIEFSRGDSYIICDSEYHYLALSADSLQPFTAKTKLFIQEAIRLNNRKTKNYLL
jgi:hypothetical protein